MGFKNRNRKRILIFLVIPILSAIPFFTEDLILRIITAAIMVIYVAFIIFLRDSVRMDDPFEQREIEDTADEGEKPGLDAYDTDMGEDFKIISNQKKIEVITADTYSLAVQSGKKNFFKPPDLKENFEKIASEELPKDFSHDEHFAFVLEKILTVIKESFMAHSAIFFGIIKIKSVSHLKNTFRVPLVFWKRNMILKMMCSAK